MLTDRFARSTREAFPWERYPAIEVYRAPLLHRWWRVIGNLSLLALLAGIGVMLAWRG